MSKDIESAVRPAHYNSGDISCIDAMIAAFGVEEVRIWCKITAFKYMWRMGKKDAEEQEVGKTKWYLDKFVELPTKQPMQKVEAKHIESIGGFKIGDVVQFAPNEYAKPEECVIDDIILRGTTIMIHFMSEKWCCGKMMSQIRAQIKHVKNE